MLNATVTKQHSHHRLIIALGLSSVLVASLLAVVGLALVDQPCSEPWCIEPAPELTVQLKQRETESLAEIVVPKYERRLIEQATTTPPESESLTPQVTDNELAPEANQDPVQEPSTTRDWYAIASEPIRQSIDDYFANEETRKKMWRQTGSVMYRDTGEFDFSEPDTVIAEVQFRRPVGVLGVGFTIGGCFFGIPLAGIPVEERSVGPNIFYCTDIYE